MSSAPAGMTDEKLSLSSQSVLLRKARLAIDCSLSGLPMVICRGFLQSALQVSRLAMMHSTQAAGHVGGRPGACDVWQKVSSLPELSNPCTAGSSSSNAWHASDNKHVHSACCR